MAYPTMAVANAFIQRARDGKLPDLSPMKLQKLLFFAQIWYLKWHDEPLIDDIFFRWQHGPVIPSLYHEFKHYGAKTIDQFGTFVSPKGAIAALVPQGDKDAWEVIDEVIRAYGDYSGWQLSLITHEGAPWGKEGGPTGEPIPNNDLPKWIEADGAAA